MVLLNWQTEEIKKMSKLLNNKNAAKPHQQRATAIINFRCSEIDKKIWQSKASAKNQTLTSWITDTLNNKKD